MTAPRTHARAGADAWAAANRERVALGLDHALALLRRRAVLLRRCWRGAGLVTDDLADRLFACADRTRTELDDAETRGLADEAATLAARAAAFEASMAARGRVSGLQRIADRFGLAAVERDAILLAAAPDIDPTFASLFGYAMDDATRGRPTPAFLAALLADAPDARFEMLARLGPDALLRRMRLLIADTAGGLGVDAGILHLVLGGEQAPPDTVAPCEPALVTGATQVLAGRLAACLDGRADHAGVVNLIGRAGSGRTHLARAICDRVGRILWRLAPASPAALAPDDVAVLARDMVLADAAVVIDAEEMPEHAATLAAALRSAGPLFILSERPLAIRGGSMAAEVARPPRVAQAALWRQALVAHDVASDVTIDALVQQFDLGPGAIARAVAAARQQAQLRVTGGRARIVAGDLWAACRLQGAGALDDLAQRLVTARRWDDLVLAPDVAAHLRELEAQVRRRPAVYERWGFGSRLGRGRGISALFAGPSGTGKTMAAEVLAAELELDLYRVDLASTLSKYIGETPKHLKRIFDAAERTGAILFFDEADALFSRRTDVRDSHDRYANLDVSYLLQRMEEYAGVAILATNRKADFDRAFLRRLRFVVEFPFPDVTVRRRLWCKAFPADADCDALDVDALAQCDLGGAAIHGVALNAAFLAAAAGTPISMAHVEHALRREYAKLEKLPAVAMRDMGGRR